MQKESIPYKTLCTQYYELDKPTASKEALAFYLKYANEACGPILEPMCGTGRFLIPITEKGFDISGFDYSPHMLKLCQTKCQKLGLSVELSEATFETFFPKIKYDLIFIPSSSFCLLTDETKISQAFKSILNWLTPHGKFVFEIETLNAVNLQQNVWKGNWVNKPDGSQIVLNTLSKFDEVSRIETILCRYELWEKNTISLIEVEDFRLKLYEPLEIESLLQQNGFRITGQWYDNSYKHEANSDSSVIIYECKKF